MNLNRIRTFLCTKNNFLNSSLAANHPHLSEKYNYTFVYFSDYNVELLSKIITRFQLHCLKIIAPQN